MRTSTASALALILVLIVATIVIWGQKRDPFPPVVDWTSKPKAPAPISHPTPRYTTAPPPPPPTLTYTVLADTSNGDHIRISIKPEGSPINQTTLKAMLQAIYDAKRGQSDGDPNWTIFVWAYPDEAHFSSGMGQWTAMMDGGAGRPTNFHFSEQGLHPLASTARALRRFSEQDEKAMFFELVRLEDQASDEASAAHPDDPMAEGDDNTRRVEAYRAAFIRKHRLKKEEISLLMADAERSNWPIPPH